MGVTNMQTAYTWNYKESKSLGLASHLFAIRITLKEGVLKKLCALKQFVINPLNSTFWENIYFIHCFLLK
jgi:hypothetical protein